MNSPDTKTRRRPEHPGKIVGQEEVLDEKPSALQEERPARSGRGAARDEAARRRLTPIEPGERPRAVTVAAILAALIGVGNIVAYLVGVREVGGSAVPLMSVLPLSLLLLVAAAGMWRARYWAVLGFQTFLAITIVLVSLTLLSRSDALAFLLLSAVLVGSGALFWFLVKAMARIQMPRARSSRGRTRNETSVDRPDGSPR